MRRTKDAMAPLSQERSFLFPSFRESATWVGEMDRWFDDLRREFESAFRTPFGSPWAQGVRRPLADVQDTGKEFIVRAEMPGLSKEDVEVMATPDSLELRAKAAEERAEEKRSYVLRERRYSEVLRTIPLPAEVDPNAAAATLRDGVLEVRLSKRESTADIKPAKVPVS